MLVIKGLKELQNVYSDLAIIVNNLEVGKITAKLLGNNLTLEHIEIYKEYRRKRYGSIALWTLAESYPIYGEATYESLEFFKWNKVEFDILTLGIKPTPKLTYSFYIKSHEEVRLSRKEFDASVFFDL